LRAFLPDLPALCSQRALSSPLAALVRLHVLVGLMLCPHDKWVGDSTVRCLTCGAVLDRWECGGLVFVGATRNPMPDCWPGNRGIFADATHYWSALLCWN